MLAEMMLQDNKILVSILSFSFNLIAVPAIVGCRGRRMVSKFINLGFRITILTHTNH